jgi:hypothetical protein
MGAGAFFLVVILLIVLVALAALVYAIAAWLRHLKLDPERDRLEGEPVGEPQREQPRAQHVRHGRAQRARTTPE